MNSRFLCILAVLCFVTTLCIASPAVDHATISESVGGHLRHLSNRSLGRRQTGKRRTNNKRPPRSCCRAQTAECKACVKGVSTEQYCRWDPSFPGCNKPKTTTQRPTFCCSAYSAKCEACKQAKTIVEICSRNPFFSDCSATFK